MKQIISFILASSCIIAAASCSKSEISDIGSPKKAAPNLITCTFANNDAATRTTVDTDGLTPLWAAGDKIMLYDGSSNTQELTLAASGTTSSTTGIIGTDAKVFTFVKPDGWEDVYAIYPSGACVSDFSASAPKINFAGQDGTFAKANICAGKVKDNAISFKNVGAIFKFPSKAATVTDILIPVIGSSNDYTLSFNDITPSLSSVSAANSRSYIIGGATGAVYVGVPATTLPSGSSFIYQSSSKSILGSVSVKNNINIVGNEIYTLPAIEANGTIPAGTLSGAFSVSATKKVYFSKGNLYCTNSPSVTYSFESNQYDFRHCNGISNDAAVIGGSLTTTPANTVGSFFWSKDASVAYASIYSDGSAATTDKFFTNDQTTESNPNSGLTVNGSTGLWRALTRVEWAYLLNTRTVNGGTEEGKSYKRTTLTLSDNTTTVYGMIIAPDSYTGSLSSATSWSNWQTMESAGCVFLPAAGSRVGDLFTGKSVSYVRTYGYYWSSTPESSYGAYYLLFYSDIVNPADYSYRGDYGNSVRLVCAAQ